MLQSAPRPELIIFDFDGVIADSEVIALSELCDLLAEHGAPLTFEAAAQHFLGRSISAAMDYLKEITLCAPDQTFVDQWHKRLFARYIREMDLVPGALNLLDTIAAAGVPVCIASGSSPRRLQFAQACLGLADRLGPVSFSADSVGKSKPEPDLFLHAARQFYTDPAKCIVIEDAPSGIEAAKAAGMASFGFVGGSHFADDRPGWAKKLRANGAAMVYDHHADIGQEITRRAVLSQ